MGFNGIPGPGRPPGTPNAKTQLGREAIAKFVDGNAERLSGWLDAIAKDSPLAAFNAFMSVVEYHIPKLARQEITGKDGERLQINVVSGVNLLPIVDAEFAEVKMPPMIENGGLSTPVETEYNVVESNEVPELQNTDQNDEK